MYSNWLYLKRQQTLWLSIFHEHFTIVLREPSGLYPQLLGSWAQEQGQLIFVQLARRGPTPANPVVLGGAPSLKGLLPLTCRRKGGWYTKHWLWTGSLILVLDLSLTHDLWTSDSWSVKGEWFLPCRLWWLERVYLKNVAMYLNIGGPQETVASNFTKPLNKPSRIFEIVLISSYEHVFCFVLELLIHPAFIIHHVPGPVRCWGIKMNRAWVLSSEIMNVAEEIRIDV